MDNEKELENGEEQPGDLFYHGIIRKIFWRSETGIVCSDSGKEVSFSFAFVTLVGVPRQDMRFLREGMRIGFDVGWTGKGLRVTTIKIYDPSQRQRSTKENKPAEELPHHRCQNSDVE